MTPDALVRTVEEFLSQAHDAVVLEDGAVAFDLAQAKYSISGERNKCLLHLWSAERNVVRRVLDLEIKNEVLRLAVQRLGQSHPTKLEICRQRDRRTPTAKRAARLAYQRLLQRVLTRKFPGFKVAKLSTSMDLERSFGPIYSRGLLQQGQSAFAVLGVNAQEAQSSIDAALTFGILWLDVCRRAQGLSKGNGHLRSWQRRHAAYTLCRRTRGARTVRASDRAGSRSDARGGSRAALFLRDGVPLPRIGIRASSANA